MPQLPSPLDEELSGLETIQPLAERRHRRRHRGPFHKVRRVLRHIRWPYILLIGIAVAALAVVGVLVIASDAEGRVQAAYTSVNRVMTTINSAGSDLTLTDFERLQSSLDEMAATLARANSQTSFLRIFANANPDIAASFGILDTGQAITLAAQDILSGLEPTLFFLASGSTDESVMVQVSSGERVVELLALGRSRFLNAQEHLQAARQHREALALGEVSASLLLTVDDLDTYYHQIQSLTDLLLDAPDLLTLGLGLDDTQNYIVLAQNSDELRPSGGYISTYGWMQVRNARILEYDYSPTTTTSPNPPDASLAGQIGLPDWWIRYGGPIYAAWDGSWYADFPSTAAMAAWYYDQGGNPLSPVDGVIAIDMVGFEYILEGLGRVVVPGYDEVVTPDNFREVVYAIRADQDIPLAHKQFVAALYRQILSDWQTVDQERGGAIVGATLRGLQEKHIMLHFTDERLNQALDILGWSGRQGSGLDHDYLMVADANLGSKSSRSVSRHLTYDMSIESDGTLSGRLTVAYDFPASVAQQDPAVRPEHYGTDIDYHNLMQVFVPAGSTLTGTDNLRDAPTVVAGATHTIFVSSIEIAYNSGERYQFSYTTPPRVETFGPFRRYRLLLQKQPGMLGEPVSVQISLPEGAHMVSTSPDVVATYSFDRQVLEFRVILATDQWIEVIFTE